MFTFEKIEDKGLFEEKAEGLSFIQNQCFEKKWSAQDFLSLLLLKTTVCFVAKDGEKMVGYLLISFIFEEAEILSLAVLPAYQRKSLAANLLQTAGAFLKEKDVKRFFLEVREKNHPALNLYQKEGFIQKSCRPSYYQNQKGQSEDALVLEKKL